MSHVTVYVSPLRPVAGRENPSGALATLVLIWYDVSHDLPYKERGKMMKKMLSICAAVMTACAFGLTPAEMEQGFENPPD